MTENIRNYQMRTMPRPLFTRLRILAAMQGTTIEAQVVKALEIGVQNQETARLGQSSDGDA